MNGPSTGFEPSRLDYVPEPLRLDRRGFLRISGLAGIGLCLGSGRASAEPLSPEPAAPKYLEPHSQACANSPFGGPFYPGVTPEIKGAEKALFDLDRAWPIGQQIVVKFLNGQGDPWTQQVQQKVRQIAPTWCDYANLTTQFVDTGPCHMTVNFFPYVDAWGRPHGYGERDAEFNCLIGTDCYKFKNQVQSMNLIFKSWMPSRWPADFVESEFHRLILHEFGHALGLIHEHQRPDRPIVWTQSLYGYAETNWGWKSDVVNDQVIKTYQSNNLGGTVFEEQSIMMYEYPPGIAYYQKEGAPPNTPDPNRPFSSPRNTSLTALDKVAASVTYPTNAAALGEDTLTVGATPRSGKIGPAGQVGRYTFTTGAAGDYTIEVAGGMPALVGLLKERNDPGTRGKLGNILSAAERGSGQASTILTARGLQANKDYFVEVRHLTPMRAPSNGDYTVAVRQGS